MVTTPPDWMADAIFYQIFPERFADGDPSLDPADVEPWDAEPTRDNFFGGDLAGITAHLDHIESLGANAIYLTPIFEADTNHRYDTKDYFAIDHRLGDIDAFRAFVAAAHGRGIRVVLDAVLNHCGEGHWAFRDAVEKQAESEYTNWFSIEGYPVVQHPEPNYRTCSGCWYLPQWNADNPEVQRHHFDVARHWIGEDIDGWRLDVPYFVNREFWRQFHDVVKNESGELCIIAEEWHDPAEWLDGDIADGTMNYTLRDLVLGFAVDGTVSGPEFAVGMNRLRARIPEPSRNAMLNLLGSHDTERVITRARGNAAAVHRALALLVGAQGMPMMYYGDEIGMAGDTDPGCRAPMIWDRSRWVNETLDLTRNLFGLRRSSEPLRRGEQEVLALDEHTVAIVRGGAVAIVTSRSDEPRTVRLPSLHPDEILLSIGDASIGPGGIGLAGHASAVVRVRREERG